MRPSCALLPPGLPGRDDDRRAGRAAARPAAARSPARCASRASWCSSASRCSTSSRARRWPTSPVAMTELAEVDARRAPARRPAPTSTRARRAARRRRRAHRSSGSSAWASSARASSTSRRDIDLVYVYDEDGETAGAARPRPHQRPRVLRAGVQAPLRADRRHHRSTASCSASTWRCGPNGNSGPPAVIARRCWRNTSRCRAANGSASPG